MEDRDGLHQQFFRQYNITDYSLTFFQSFREMTIFKLGNSGGAPGPEQNICFINSILFGSIGFTANCTRNKVVGVKLDGDLSHAIQWTQLIKQSLRK